MKGQVQTEFADIVSMEKESSFNKPGGHLSMDYTCMKWLSCDRKVQFCLRKKRNDLA